MVNIILHLLAIILLLPKGLVEANPLTNDGGQLSGKVVVTRDTECSEPCDLEVGQCDERGKCVCNEGRKGTNCSKVDFPDFPTDPAAKLDVALSLLAACVLLTLVACAAFPTSAIRLRYKQRRRGGKDSQFDAQTSVVEVIKNTKT